MSRSLLVAMLAAVAALMPAAARAQAGPTLTFNQSCYTETDSMVYSGTGYTPGGAINFFVNSLETQKLVMHDAVADAGGAIAGSLPAPSADDFIPDDAFSAGIGATANDRTRLDQNVLPPEQQFAGAALTLTRSEVELEQPNGSSPRAAKRMRVTAVGFIGARGRTLYVHYAQRSRRLASVKLGRVAGACGNRTRVLRRGLPRGLRPGRYSLVFNTSARRLTTGVLAVNELRLR